jgi:adenine-specific DNA methylase
MRGLLNPMGLNDYDLDDPFTIRKTLLDFIADFSNWEKSIDERYIAISQKLTQTAIESLGGESGVRPLIIDPFAGGGSIPLEALRIGADSYASDLNPIPILINKTIIDYIPRYGISLSKEVKERGMKIRQLLKNELNNYYCNKIDSEQCFGFFWARTILCEGPSCGYRYPLLRSLWLRKKLINPVALELKPNESTRSVDVNILENVNHKKVGKGTSKQGSATCPVCGFTTPVEHVRSQLSNRRGGTIDAQLIAVGLFKSQEKGKTYRKPTKEEVEKYQYALSLYRSLLNSSKNGLAIIPDEKLNHLRGFFNVVLYGMESWGDLFNPRQAILMTTLVRLIEQEYQDLALSDKEFAKAVATCLTLAAGKVAQYNSSCCRWKPTGETIVDMFGRQAIPMVWDFTEAYPFSNSTGDIAQYIEAISLVIENLIGVFDKPGTVFQGSATDLVLPDDSVDAYITDPPYYDAIPYADLSDFFYVWIRRTLKDAYPELLEAPLTPKKLECVTLAHRAAMYRNKDKQFFEKMMTTAAQEGRRVTKPNGVGLFVFANKATSGWEAMLNALIDSSWTIIASWPIDTEMSSRLRAQGSAVLGSSVHLVCRPLENLDGTCRVEIGDWRDILSELPIRIHEWMPRLAKEGVVGADAIFACLGPALEIFSRYSRVEKASGEQVTLREYLEHVWAAVSREALGMIFEGADATGFEEDARITAMWLWTLKTAESPALNGKNEIKEQQEENEDVEDEEEGSGKKKVKGFSLEYDAARKIAQGLGAHLEEMHTLVEIKKGNARLLPVSERAAYLLKSDKEKPIRRPKKKEKQATLFPLELEGSEEPEEDFGDVAEIGKTTLDRVHQSMLLFATGQSDALKRFLVDEGIGKNAQFWKLAQALAALYPTGTEEKRWVEGVLARKKGLGL